MERASSREAEDDLQPRLAWAELEGERVVLRPTARADAEVAFPMIHGRREILDWLIWQGPDSVEELAEQYAYWVRPSDDAADYHFAIEERSRPGFRGAIGVRFVGHPFVANLGYWLDAESWGQGLMTEAVFLASHLAFRHLRARLACAEVLLGNEASMRVLEKNGFVREPKARTVRIGPRGATRARRQWIYALERGAFLERARGRWPREEAVRVEG